MPSQEYSKPGFIAAFALALLATAGALISQSSLNDDFDILWLFTFGGALVTLSGAAVNFDPKRLIK